MAAIAFLNSVTAEIRRVRSSEISFLSDNISAAWSDGGVVVALLFIRQEELEVVAATAAAGDSVEQSELYSKIAAWHLRGGR